MMSSPSSEEVNAQRSDFGLRLSNSMAKYGPLCVGIDPHRQLLTDWGYNVDALGAELYSMRMLQAANGRAASPNAVKFNKGNVWLHVRTIRTVPNKNRHRREIALRPVNADNVLYAARQMGVITIVDCLHGGLSTTISAFADAYFKPGAPLHAITITAHGHRHAAQQRPCSSLGVQPGRRCRDSSAPKGKTVAYGIASTAQKFNKGNDGMGSVGLIVPPSGSGSTIRASIRPSSPDRFFPQATDGRERKNAGNIRVQRHQGQCAGHGISFHRHAWSRHRKIEATVRQDTASPACPERPDAGLRDRRIISFSE